MDDERDIPRLVVEMPAGNAEAILAALPALIERGAEGVLVTAGGAAPATLVEPVSRIAAAADGLPILLVGPPSVAGEAGAGLVLPELGMASSEARRQIRSGALMGRDVSSIEAAALARGVEFLVGGMADLGGGGSRIAEAIEAAPVPILWRVGGEGEARDAIALGAEGVVLASGPDPMSEFDALSSLAALFPARTASERTVVLNGAPVPLLPDTAITDMLGDFDLEPATVRRNGAAVPRRLWDDTLLVPGDVLETSG